ncbi:MAG: hypothetical protein K8R92_09075 [Planctomycetes bacterium]|nr:hypothetical protein [Planctomycetota bacterium]
MNSIASMNIVCCALLTGAVTGCDLQPASPKQGALPANSFSLSVQKLVTGGDVEITQLTLRLPGNASISVDGEHFHSCTFSQTPNDATPREGQVIVSGSRITPPGNDKAYIQTSFRPQSNGTSAGGTVTYPVPPNQTLESYFPISAADGIYKLDTPIEIAKVDGKPVVLTVGNPTKSDLAPSTSGQ